MNGITIRYVFARQTDEKLEVRQAPSGGYICPVCGHVHLPCGEAPWEDTTTEHFRTPFATGSFGFCPDCDTQYGFDDVPPFSGGMTFLEKWWQLRLRWLDQNGWAPAMLGRVVENLGISKDELERRREVPR